MSVLGGNADSFKNCISVQGTALKPSLEKIDVTDVRFEDGTTWKKGVAFVRAFDQNGNHVAIAAPVGGATPAPSGDAQVSIGGATAVGGTVGPTGPAFGTIAWIPGSRTAFAAVADAPTQADADFAAMTKCTQLANGAAGCKPVVRMFGADKKCGAIATDTVKFSSSRGPGLSLDDPVGAQRAGERRRHDRRGQHHHHRLQHALTGRSAALRGVRKWWRCLGPCRCTSSRGRSGRRGV